MKKIHHCLGIMLTAIFFLAMGCKPERSVTIEPEGLELENMDTTANPANDFYNYVNGAWMASAEIPADRQRWGSFDELRKQTNNGMLEILERTMKNNEYPEGSDQYKAIQFYSSGMNTEAIEDMGAQPLEPYLTEIAKIQTLKELQTHLENVSPFLETGFFSFGVLPDLRNSTVNTAYLGPGFLGLPERDYYLKTDEESTELRTKYASHIARMLGQIGIPDDQARQKADDILEIESQMATHMLSKEESRNPLNLYHKYSMSDLQKLTPSFQWAPYFEKIGVAGLDTIIVTQPKYMQALESLMAKGEVDRWRDYLIWSLVNQAAPYLSSTFEDENFDFFGRTLNGTEEMKPRSERILDNTNSAMGEALGRLYVDAYFPSEAKAKAKEMVDNLLAACGERIRNLDWMTDATKKKAAEKLKSFNVKIGYPDEWKDYSALEIAGVEDGGSYIQNVMNASRWNFEDDLRKINKEVDKSEWFMPPQMVNAYYNPLFNEIVFPAAILQPPFYNYRADDAVNYGGIGAVIGHEISHGFDDQGSRFDASGNMNNWWTDEDRQAFEERNQGLIDQFDQYEALPGVFVNGRFTLGENIGDLGGLNIAYDALQRHFAKKGKPDAIDDLTPEQRFFISWATIWRTKIRDEALKTRINTDPHSPGYYRAIGPLSNMESFYEAFDVKEGDALYRPDSIRVRIW